MATMTAPAEESASSSAGQLSSYLIFSAIVVALGSLLFGFETAVISGTTGWLVRTFHLNDAMLGLVVSSSLFGCIIGSALVARPAAIWGSKAILFGVAALYVCTALGCALATTLESFVFFRVIGGIAVGAASVVAPMYIAELSPARYRGRLVTITQFNIVTGILLSYLSNYAIAQLALGDNEARWMLGVMAVPAILFFLLLMAAPQSPRWLVAKGRIGEARRVFLRCGTDSGNVEEEIAAVKWSFKGTAGASREPLFQRKYGRVITLALAIAVFNQLSGINAILYYMPTIFEMAGAAKASALMQSVIVGFILMAFTFAAILSIDRVGRRNLLLVGCVGYIISLTTLAWLFTTGNGGWLVLAAVCLFVASHAFGNGAVIWVFIGEIFPNSVRASGQSLGTLTHWLMAALVSWSFPILAATSAAFTFSFYAICMIGQLVWILLWVPETKGIALETIAARLGIK